MAQAKKIQDSSLQIQQKKRELEKLDCKKKKNSSRSIRECKFSEEEKWRKERRIISMHLHST